MPEVPDVIVVDDSADEADSPAEEPAAAANGLEDMATLKARRDRERAEFAAQTERDKKHQRAEADAAEARADAMEAAYEKTGVIPADEDLRAYLGIGAKKGKKSADSGNTAKFKELNPLVKLPAKNFFNP
jgi:hypothetical protein